jgi:tetratricopeptide (TPR) repeat protein
MDVFLSYARSATRPFAEAVQRELGSNIAFLDTEEIEHGDHFPQRLIDALLACRIVVIFADQTYFTRWYCILEFRAALAPFTYLAERGKGSPAEHAKALEPVVVVLPPIGAPSLDMWNLPPELQQVNWANANDSAAIAAQVRSRLAKEPPILRDRIEITVGQERFRREWLEVARLPPPEQIPSEVPFVYSSGLPRSLDEGFFGRLNDLWRIHNALTKPHARSQSAAVALEGGAAVGKSTLAREYVYRFGPRYYPGGLFWIDAERPLESQYHQILLALDPQTPELNVVQKESGGVSNRLVAAFRALPVEKPSLVVVDNIPEPQPGHAPKQLDDWFPAARYCRFLTTSRNRTLKTPGVVSLEVGVLDDWSAQALLTSDIDFGALNDGEWREITDWVGGLPLALELLNRALAAYAFTTDELLARARSEATTNTLDQAMDALRPVLPAGSLRGASEALIFSYERLTDQAKEAARLIAWLAPAPIPEALQSAISVDRFERTVRSMLIARSLVIRTQVARVPIFGSMHAVVGDFLQTRSEDQPSELTSLTKALLTVMNQERIQTPSEWPLIAACEPHAVVLLNHVGAQDPRIDFVDHIAMLACALVLWYIAQGRSVEAAGLAFEALGATSIETEPDHFVAVESPGVQQLTRILPQAFAQNREYDVAIQLQRNYLEYLQQQNGADEPVVLAESDNLALMLRDRGNAEDLEEAHQILDRTAAAWRTRDPLSKDTLTALNNLALVEARRGETAHAVTLFEEVIEALQGIENAEMETILSKQSLANTLLETDPDRALVLFGEALVTADSVEIPDTHWVKLELLERLGGTAHKRGDYLQARMLLRRAVTALENSRGKLDPGTTIYAWALFDSEVRTGDKLAASNTRSRYLEWLTTTDDDLTPEQERIRADVVRRDQS